MQQPSCCHRAEVTPPLYQDKPDSITRAAPADAAAACPSDATADRRCAGCNGPAGGSQALFYKNRRAQSTPAPG